MTLRTQIEDVLAQAERVDEQWREVLAEVGEQQCPPAKAHEADDDARRDLAFAATAVLRDVLAMVAKGEDIAAALRPEAPELIVMQWDEEEEDGFDVEYPSPYGPRYDEVVYLQPGEVFTICPVCWRANGGVTVVDRGERWSRGVFEETQPDTHMVFRGAERVAEPNPLAGLPVLAVMNGDRGDYETDRHQCTACDAPVSLPEWIVESWS